MTQDSSLTTSTTAALLAVDSGDEEVARRNRQRLVALLRGRWYWGVLLAVVLGGSLAVIGWFSVTFDYAAVGTLEILADRPEVMGGIRTEDDKVPRAFDRYLRMQRRMMTSPAVVSRVLDDPQVVAYLNTHDTVLVPAHFKGGRVEVDQSDYLFDISFKHKDPGVTAVVVNALMDAYKAEHDQKRVSLSDNISKILAERRTSLQNEIDVLQRRRDALAQEYGGDSLTTRYRVKLEKLEELELLLSQTQNRILELDPLSDQDTAALTMPELIHRDPTLRVWQTRKEDLEAFIAEKRQQGMLDNHPQMRKLLGELRALNQRMEQYARDLQAGGTPATSGASVGTSAAAPTETTSIDLLRARERQLRQLVSESQAEVSELGRKQDQISRVDQDIDQLEQRLEAVKWEEEKRRIPDPISSEIMIRSYAEAPGGAYNADSRKKRAVLGGGGGAVMGFGLVMLIGLLDRRLRHVDDAQLDLSDAGRLLGILPTLPADLTDPEQAEVAALSVHHIRTLLQVQADDGSAVFSVTSPAAGSGKSSLTMALGLSFAASGARTLMIDADIVGAGLTRRLGASITPSPVEIVRDLGLVDSGQLDLALSRSELAGEPLDQVLLDMGEIDEAQAATIRKRLEGRGTGIVDACRGKALSDCVTDAGAPGLDILPIGSARRHDAGTLSPSNIRRLIAQARAAYDMVLVDTGPVLGSIEASIVGAEADGVVFIVSRGDQKQIAGRAVRSLRDVGAKLLGVVFNHALDHDVERSSYGSVSMSVGGSRPAVTRLDRGASERFGPLASAVVSYGSEGNGAGEVQGNGRHG